MVQKQGDSANLSQLILHKAEKYVQDWRFSQKIIIFKTLSLKKNTQLLLSIKKKNPNQSTKQ